MLLHFLKNPREIGALCSSSKRLGEVITHDIGIEHAKYIVEIGPGFGVFTHEILKKKPKDSIFFALENNPKIASILQQKMKDIEILNESAAKILDIMQARSIASLDVIVSGLPWTIFSQEEQDTLLTRIYQSLNVYGCFATFAYVLPTRQAKIFRKKLYRYFQSVTISNVVWNNFPPAYVYYCKKLPV